MLRNTKRDSHTNRKVANVAICDLKSRSRKLDLRFPQRRKGLLYLEKVIKILVSSLLKEFYI